MATATLTIDLDALIDNWRALDAKTDCATSAVVKADGYGLGAGRVARALMRVGVDQFFVAAAEEGAALRREVGPDPTINVFSGHMRGDTDMISDMMLVPMLNSTAQIERHMNALPAHPFGIQLDSGMNRLGLEADEWDSVKDAVLSKSPKLLMSHLACADEPEHPMNAQQLAAFKSMTDGLAVPRSLAATGGILLGADYHFDLTRPGVGLYGGLPFEQAKPVAYLSVPVIQIRDVAAGESVGYGNTWIAQRDSRVATIAAGYADGIIRAMGEKVDVFSDQTRCPVIGRISMDMIGVDVTALKSEPRTLDLLGDQQTVDTLATAAGTIGYEILTSMGQRYQRRYAAA